MSSYNYGFQLAEANGRKVVRYRQDKLGLKSAIAWFVFLQLIVWFFAGFGNGAGLPIFAVAGLALWRSRMHEISIGSSDVTVSGKRYDRTKITKLFVKKLRAKSALSAPAQNYDEIARKVELDPVGGSPELAKASAMAADATTAVSGLTAAGIDSTGRQLQMMYDGKAVTIAKWLSFERASILAEMIGGQLGLVPDARGN